jgi:predicted Zn-dependent protease
MRHHKSMTTRFSMRPSRLTFALLAALMAFSGVPATAQGLGGKGVTSGASLPALGDNLDMTSAKERRIGDRIASSIFRDPDYLDDPVLTDYVQGIWQPLMTAARARGELGQELDDRFAWQLFLLRDRSINAFALPGGYFGVHLGLVGVVSSRDELAAVLGHEMSHVTQRHIARLMTQQSQQAPWVMAAMVLGALAASKSPNAASAAIVGGQALAVQNQLNFSRDMEREADRVGFGVMTDAGFDSRGVAAMFEKLQQASRLNDNGAFPYLRSHPLNTQRIAEAQSRLQLAVPPAPLTGDAAQDAVQTRVVHAMVAARARVLAAPGVDQQRSMIEQARARSAAAVSTEQAMVADAAAVGALYAGALAAAQLRDFGQARSLLAALTARTSAYPQAKTTGDLLVTEIDMMEGKVPAAGRTIDMATLRTRAELLVYGRAALAAQRPQDVASRLQTWVAERPKDAAAWQLLSAAYTAQGQQVRAVRSDAESRFAELDYPAALDRFKAAQGLMRSNRAAADYVEGSIIDTRTRQTEALIREQALQDKIDR